jgi:hypothetical protein
MSLSTCLRMVIGVGLIGLLAACQANPPPGRTGGRIDPYRSTPADVHSSGASLPALLEFCDQAAAALARDLTAIPAIRDASSKSIVELGSIRNQTRTPTSNFEQMQARLRSQLFSSDIIRSHIVLTEDPARMDRELERLGATGTGGSTARYPAQATYVLQGDFFESGRDNRRQYFFEFKLVNLATREIVFSHAYDLGQVTPRSS